MTENLNLFSLVRNYVKDFENKSDIEILKYFGDIEILQSFADDENLQSFEITFEEVETKIGNCENFRNMFKDLDESRFKHVKLSDYFNEVKKTKNYKYSTTNISEGDVPLYAGKKRGVVSFVKNEEAEGHYLVVIRHKDTTCGYCFENNGPLAWTTSCFVYEPIKDIDLKINSLLLTLQISPKHTDADHFTSKQFLNKVVYLYC